MPKKESQISIKARLNLKLDRELKDWVMAYADRKGTTVSNLIRNYFVCLYEAELSEDGQEIVSQI